MSRNYGSQFTLENMLCNKRGHRNAKPMDLNQSNRPSPQLVKKPHKAMKTQDSQKKKNFQLHAKKDPGRFRYRLLTVFTRLCYVIPP